MSQGITLSREFGLLRVGTAASLLCVADVDFNVESIIEAMKKARNEGVNISSFCSTY